MAIVRKSYAQHLSLSQKVRRGSVLYTYQLRHRMLHLIKTAQNDEIFAMLQDEAFLPNLLAPFIPELYPCWETIQKPKHGSPIR